MKSMTLDQFDTYLKSRKKKYYKDIIDQDFESASALLRDIYLNFSIAIANSNEQHGLLELSKIKVLAENISKIKLYRFI